MAGTFVPSITSFYAQGVIKPAPEALGLWDRKNRKRNATTRGVVAMAPHNTGPEVYFPSVGDEVQTLARRGFCVVMPYPDSPVQGQTFGNDDAIDSVDKARQFLENAMSCRTDGVYCLGMSMGGTILNWVRTQPAKVKGVALVTPLLDLAWAYGFAAPPYPAEFDAAYVDHAGFLAGLPTHSPLAYAATISQIPIRIWYSNNDPQVPFAAGIQPFVTAHGNTTLVNMGDVGHNPSGAAGADIADWFASLGG